MKPEFRIVENKKGKFEVFYVETKGGSYFFKDKEVLKPFITYAGSNKIYSFESIENAIKELKQEVIIQTERI